MLRRASELFGSSLLLLVCVGSQAGCESGSDSGARGGSDAGGSAGSSAGTSSGGGGASGDGGTASQVITACPGVVPPSTAIADFEDAPEAGDVYEWGSAEQGTTDFWGGTFNYPDALELAFDAGSMTAAGSITEYAGFGLYVQNCADASSFVGVRFTISGSVTGKMRFAVQTNQNEWATGEKGSCLAPDDKKFVNCVHPSVEIPMTDVPMNVNVMWADLKGGKPASAATTDGSDVIGLQFILPWTETSAPYAASVTIDDVELLGPDALQGNAGAGTGGASAGTGEAGAGGQ